MAPLSESHGSATGGNPFGGLIFERGSSCGNVAQRRIATAGLLLGLSAAGGGTLSPSQPSRSAPNSGARRAVIFRAPPARKGAAAALSATGSANRPLHATSTGSAGDALVQVHVAKPAEVGAGDAPCNRVRAILSQQQQQPLEPTKAAARDAAAAVVPPSYGTYGEPQPLDAMDAGALMLPRRLSRSAFDVRGGGGNMSPTPIAAGWGATSGRSLLRRHDSNSARRRSCQSGLPPQLIAISDYLSNANNLYNAGHCLGGGVSGAGVGTSSGGGGGAADGGRRAQWLGNLGSRRSSSNVQLSLTSTAPNLSLTAQFGYGGTAGSRQGSRGVLRRSVPDTSDSFMTITSRSRPPCSPAPGCIGAGSASSSQIQVAVTTAGAGDAQPRRHRKASSAQRSGQAAFPREGTDQAAATAVAAATTNAAKTGGMPASAGGRREGAREDAGCGGESCAPQGWAAARRRMQLRWAAVKSSLRRLTSPLTACSRP